MMKILLDNIIFSHQRAGGVSVYWYELISRLQKEKNIDIAFLDYEEGYQNIFRKLMKIDVKSKINVFSLVSGKLKEFTPVIYWRNDLDLYQSSYYRPIISRRKVKKVVTVYDFTYKKTPNSLTKRLREWQKEIAIKQADAIICISENTKKDLLQYIPNTIKKKVKVIYISASAEFYPLSIETIEKQQQIFSNINLKKQKYITYVGDRAATYKNFVNFVTNFSQLTSNKKYSLIIVGGGSITNEEKYLLQNISYIHFDAASSEKLNFLYNISFCLVYPSLYEGFGIPVVEAMQAGCPVIALNTSSIPELMPNRSGGILMNKMCVEELSAALSDIEDNRSDYVSRGIIQAKKFSWDKCYIETYELYKELLDS